MVAAVVFWLPLVWLTWKHGALALAIAFFVGLNESCPWTLDLSRWYVWRQWTIVVMFVALALWGFANVLGKQSALPTGALDA
jgi:hypothetical protein